MMKNIKFIASKFVFIFGILWLILEPIGLFFPKFSNVGWRGYISIILVSVLVILIFFRPKNKVSVWVNDLNLNISVSTSDILNQNGSIIIGVCDTFDTELGDIISPESLQGQFTTRIFNSNVKELDGLINKSLEENKCSFDTTKSFGKQQRYPMGTIACIKYNNNKYFLTAFSRMKSDEMRVKTDIDTLWDSLVGCWRTIRNKGDHKNIHVPLICSKYGRTGLPSNLIIQLIIISFVLSSRIECISDSLTIHIHKNNSKNIDFESIAMWLNQLNK